MNSICFSSIKKLSSQHKKHFTTFKIQLMLESFKQAKNSVQYICLSIDGILSHLKIRFFGDFSMNGKFLCFYRIEKNPNSDLWLLTDSWKWIHCRWDYVNILFNYLICINLMFVQIISWEITDKLFIKIFCDGSYDFPNIGL